MLDYWTGSTLYQFISPRLETSDEEDKRGHCSPLLNQRRTISLFFLFLHVMQATWPWERKGGIRTPSIWHQQVGTQESQLIKHLANQKCTAVIAKILKAFYSKNVSWCPLFGLAI